MLTVARVVNADKGKILGHLLTNQAKALRDSA